MAVGFTCGRCHHPVSATSEAESTLLLTEHKTGNCTTGTEKEIDRV